MQAGRQRSNDLPHRIPPIGAGRNEAQERTVGWSDALRSPKNYGFNDRKLRDQAMRERKVDQLGAVFDAQRLHHPILVIFYGSCRKIQRRSDSLGRAGPRRRPP